MIDHPSRRRTKPVIATYVSQTTVRCNCNCHDDTALNVAARDAGNRNERPPGRMQVSCFSDSRGGVVDVGAAPSTWWWWSRLDDDGELAADAEVCWLLRHAAATPTTTPETTDLPVMDCDDDAPLTAPRDLDELPPPYFTAYVPPSRRRPCLNFDKMQVGGLRVTQGDGDSAEGFAI